MSSQLLTHLTVGVTFALYIGIAIWSRAGSTSEFYVAGGRVGPLANSMATALSNAVLGVGKASRSDGVWLPQLDDSSR